MSSDPVPAVTRDQVESEGIDWTRAYLTAQKRFEDVCMAVLAKAAEGGSMAAVVDLVGDWLDGCDCVDDESLALFLRAKEAAEAPQPKVLWEGETTFIGARSNPQQDASWFLAPYSFAVEGYPPGTKVAVVVVEAPASPAPEEPTPAEPEQKLVGLMEALDQSVREAKAARDRHVARRAPEEASDAG